MRVVIKAVDKGYFLNQKAAIECDGDVSPRASV